MNDTKCGALALKLARILGEIGKVPKSGHNSFHKYDYVTENDLVYAVREKLAAAGVFVFTSVENQTVQIITEKDKEGDEKSWALTTITTKHTFIDGETGENFSVLSQGQGADNGDKGGYKATTGAMKYFLYKCFMIPTGDDPESDSKTDERAARGASRSSSPAAGRYPDRAGPSGHPEETSRNVTPSKPASVPRDPGVDEVTKLRAQFEGNKWQTVKIHFGADKGKTLSSMTAAKLAWWIDKYAPAPFEGKMNPDDLMLRAALDVANIEWK